MLEHVNLLNDILWDYLGFFLIVLTGLYFSFKSKFFQISIIKRAKKQVEDFYYLHKKSEPGIHPFKLYFASIGGSIGLGNIAVVSSSIAIGGPGALFWLWCSSFFGSVLKYCEIYLGVTHRVQNPKTDGYDGGPMYFLLKAFPRSMISGVVAVLLCIYGTEIYQFSFVTENLSKTYGIWKPLVLAVMLGLSFYGAFGGVRRLANINTFFMPLFLLMYIVVCFYIIFINAHMLPEVFKSIFKSAFTGQAAVGGFVGSTILQTMHQGISTAVYSGDICIGYDSMVQAETRVKDAAQQARFSVLSLFTDSFICTLSMVVVLCTGLWMEPNAINCNCLLAEAVEMYIPFTKQFMSVLFFLTGFTTVTAYLTIGYKAARFLSEKYGPYLFSVFAVSFFIFFAYADQTIPLTIMTTTGGLLVLFNVIGIIRLRKEIKFS